MPLGFLLKKATGILGQLGLANDPTRPPPLDGEIIYCKNNVCVHPPGPLNVNTIHHPGYLTIRAQDDEVLGSTLILTWIPNTTLQRKPSSAPSTPSTGSPPGDKPAPPPRKFSHDIPGSSDMVASHRLLEHADVDLESGTKNSSSLSLDRSCSDSGYADDTVSKHSSAMSEQHQQFYEKILGQTVGLEPSVMSQSDTCAASGSRRLSHKSVDSAISSKNQSPVDADAKTTAGDISMSSDSESITTETQLALLIARNDYEQGLRDEQQIKGDSQAGSKGAKLLPWQLSKHVRQALQTDFDNSSVSSDDTSAGNSPWPSPKKKMPDYTVVHANKELCDTDVDEELESPGNGHIHRRMSDSSSTSSTDTDTTQDGDSCPPSPTSSQHATSPTGAESIEIQNRLERSLSDSNPEGLVVTYNLTFPENSVSYVEAAGLKGPGTAREQLCGVFSADLGQMRSLRLFFNDGDGTCGQLVIASRESQYKILHFHHGGLDRLAEMFEEWRHCTQAKANKGLSDQFCRQFSINRPSVTAIECHPDEDVYGTITLEIWQSYFNDRGQVEDEESLKKAIFFGGLDPSVRKEAWPFLLHYFCFQFTSEGREEYCHRMSAEYQAIQDKRLSMSDEEKEHFWRTVQVTVDKDVVRTDRSNPYFKGDNNPHVEMMRKILLNYAYYNPSMGYTQGMSDLLAPVLVEVHDEADAFWCFVGLMQNTIFVSSPTDADMDKQLMYLRELLRVMQPNFYQHLVTLGDAMELLFCHRWILLCFKREFPEADALRMWEACWAHYQTDYFHLFICLAIIAVYGDDLVQQKLPSDEMLLHFSNLAMHMNGDVVLRKARGLLHQFRLLPRIPCTLHGLCKTCGPGMWDSGHVPTVECTGCHNEDGCPYGGVSPQQEKPLTNKIFPEKFF
ncbi:TBC1 domain family member 16-like [Branchiostoma floridae]|uniref:TBC1 domain family member 16-like n=1 Tax=Branchiostoma floridae TaxID=7739 RepID=A0A9J7M6W6_BRAFL|nr:TBC1 domain family member 16-like [Branchiostoma floridae]XP_035695304.1 TBC1 domain family member 16-like [Branchiostoma floridae]